MIGHLRVKSPWTQLGLFLGLFGAAFLITAVIMAIVVLVSGIPGAAMGKLDLSRPEFVSKLKVIQALSSVTLFLAPAFAFAILCFRGRPMYFLGLKRSGNLRFYLLAIVC